MTASLSARILCTSDLDASEVTHLDSPVLVATLPSRLIAIFRVTKGRPVVIHFMYGSF